MAQINELPLPETLIDALQSALNCHINFTRCTAYAASSATFVCKHFSTSNQFLLALQFRHIMEWVLHCVVVSRVAIGDFGKAFS
jgi:hypothetical protein